MIIHNGKDYYDSAAAYGADTSVHLVRNNDKTKPDLLTDQFYLPKWDRHKVAGGVRTDIVYAGAILAMGKSYPFLFVSEDEIYFSIEDFKKNHPFSDVFGRRHWTYELTWQEYTDHIQFSQSRVEEFLLQNKATFALILDPACTIGGRRIDSIQTLRQFRRMGMSLCYLNPAFLKDFNFASVVNPFDFFQQAERWLTGVLANNPKIDQISDKSKIVKAGFDLKISFRNMK